MEERIMVESILLSCIYKDLTLVGDISEDYFSDDKTIFFYILAREMSKTIKEIDMISVCSWCKTNGVSEVFEKYGGYESIENLFNLNGNVENFHAYADDLRKHILIDDSKELGIDLNREYEINGEKVVPMEILPYVDSIKLSGIIQSLVANIGVKVMEHKDKFESLHYTDEEIKKKEEGEEDTTAQFDITLTYSDLITGEPRYIQSFKMLNDEVNGVCRQNGVFFLGASSGTGKSSVTLQIVLGLVEDGEKVLLTSNEQTSKYFKDLLNAFITINVFKCYTVTRKKISKWNLTDEEKEMVLKANEFIKEKYADKITFWAVNEFNFNKITNKMKKLQMTEGYRYLVLDTFKPTALSSTNVTNEYVELSRNLDLFGRQNDIGVICPIQLLTSTDKVSYLTSSQITNGKQIKEIGSKIILFRKCRNAIELNQSNESFFLKPFVWQRNEITKKYDKRYLKIIDSSKDSEKKYEYDKYCVDINKRFLVVFIDKNRSGGDAIVYLYQFDGNSGRITEKGLCEHVSTGMLMQ